MGENGGTEDEVVAALLHDAPEDQGGTKRLDDIRAKFGSEVAEIVAGCTDTYETPKPPWRSRKERYIDHLRHAPSSVKLVSAADKLHNAGMILTDLRAIGDDLWERFNGGKQGTLWYYRAVTETLEENGVSPVVDELRRVVDEVEKLAQRTTEEERRAE